MFNDVLKFILDNDDKKGRTAFSEGIDYLKSYDDYNDTDIFDYEYQIEKEEETEPKYRSMKNTKPKDMQNVVEGKKMFMSNNFTMVHTKVFIMYLLLASLCGEIGFFKTACMKERKSAATLLTTHPTTKNYVV